MTGSGMEPGRGQGSGSGRGQGRAARRGRGWLLAASVIAVLAVGGGAIAARTMIDPDALRQVVAQAVWRQTGRTLHVGSVAVHVLPYPSVTVDDVALSDMPGGARANMLSAASLQARLALLPLLRHEIRLEDVRLAHPDLLVERLADGRANWQMRPPPAPGPESVPGGAGGPSAAPRWRVRIGSVRVQDAVLTWDDREAHATGAVAVDHLLLDGLAGDAPTIDLRGHRPADAGVVFTLLGHVGRLAAPLPDAWPVRLYATLEIAGVRQGDATLDGSLSDPARLRGYDVAVRGNLGQLAALNRLFVHAGLPAVRDIVLDARIVDLSAGGPAAPGLRYLHLRTGAADIGAWVPGLHLDHLALDAPTPADHLAVQAAGAYDGRPFDLQGALGTLAEIRAAVGTRLGTALPVDLTLRQGGASLKAGGSIGGAQSALDLHMTADRLALPGGRALDRLTADAHLAARGGEEVQLSGLRLDAAQLALAGDLTLARHAGTNGLPLLTGRVRAARLDLDALRPVGPVAEGASETAAPPAPAPAPASGSVPAEQAAALPFGRLHLLDGDLDLSAAQMRLGGETYRDAQAHIALHGGRLAVDPLRADGTDRRVNGTLTIDDSGAGAGAVPRLSASLGSLVVPAEWAAVQAGMPPYLHGALQLVGTLEAQGRDRAALRTSLTGHLGLSLVNGQIDGRALGALLGPAAGAAQDSAAGLRCLAVHMGLADGRAALDTIGMQTYRLSVTGHGTIGLADQALDLHLVPQVLIGGTGAAMPVAVGGTVQAPRPRMDRVGPQQRFTLSIGPSSAIADPCPAALLAAREGQLGPSPGAAPKAKAPKALDFLRGLGLFR